MSFDDDQGSPAKQCADTQRKLLAEKAAIPFKLLAAVLTEQPDIDQAIRGYLKDYVESGYQYWPFEKKDRERIVA